MDQKVMLDRNDDVQAEFQLLIKSVDRIRGTTSNAYFGLNLPILGVDGIRLQYFQGYNILPNVTSLNNSIRLNSSNLGLFNLDFPVGHYVCGVGTITYADATLDLTVFTNDIRFFLLRQWGGLATSITLNPATGFLTINWAGALGGVQVMSTTTATWLGFPLNGPFTLATTGISVLNLANPMSIAISTPDFHNKGFVDTYRIPSNDFLDVIPVTSDFSDVIFYEPTNPIQLQVRNTGRPLAAFQVKFVDPVTRLELPMTEWQMSVVFRATTLVPY